MLIAFLINGLILIVAGILVKYNPNLIAGYNTLSKEKKKEINIEKVSTIVRNWLIITGALIIDSTCIMYILESSEITQITIISIIFITGLLAMLILVNRVSKIK